jgi:hypothetical protein
MNLREELHKTIDHMDDAQLEQLRLWWIEKQRIQEDIALWKAFFEEFLPEEAQQFARDTERHPWIRV